MLQMANESGFSFCVCSLWHNIFDGVAMAGLLVLQHCRYCASYCNNYSDAKYCNECVHMSVHVFVC